MLAGDYEDGRQFAFRYLCPSHAVVLCGYQMILERRVRQPLRHARHHRHHAAVPKGKVALSAPHLSEQNVVVELCEFGGRSSPRTSLALPFLLTRMNVISKPDFRSRNELEIYSEDLCPQSDRWRKCLGCPPQRCDITTSRDCSRDWGGRLAFANSAIRNSRRFGLSNA